MHKTSKKIFQEIERERPPCERYFLLKDHACQGRSTMEHAFTHRGKQIPEKWAVIRLCYWAHLGPGLDKRKNEWIALTHMQSEDLEKYPGKDWVQLAKYLTKKLSTETGLALCQRVAIIK